MVVQFLDLLCGSRALSLKVKVRRLSAASGGRQPGRNPRLFAWAPPAGAARPLESSSPRLLSRLAPPDSHLDPRCPPRRHPLPGPRPPPGALQASAPGSASSEREKKCGLASADAYGFEPRGLLSR